MTGQVVYLKFELGFWAIQGDDARIYDPAGTLAEQFRQEGLRVSATLVRRPDRISSRMTGPIVDIVTIERGGACGD